MATDADTPADTRIMAVVHWALRRDLDRAQRELTTEPFPAGSRRRALGEHVLWLMDFLHKHHSGEDAGLWPLVRRRNPAAVALLDSLEDDHRRIAPAVDRLAAAARAYVVSADDDARLLLRDAVERLLEVLVPHLEREVAEAMPVVSESISAREWKQWDTRYNVRGRSPRQLGLTGHFLIDGADAESRDVVLHVVPPVPRFVLVHGFARTYRRAAGARWRPETAQAALVAGPA